MLLGCGPIFERFTRHTAVVTANELRCEYSRPPTQHSSSLIFAARCRSRLSAYRARRSIPNERLSAAVHRNPSFTWHYPAVRSFPSAARRRSLQVMAWYLAACGSISHTHAEIVCLTSGGLAVEGLKCQNGGVFRGSKMNHSISAKYSPCRFRE